MTNLPARYDWLNKIGVLPKMISEALKEFGTQEVAGAGNSPKILAWAKEVGVQNEYTADAIPWCGLFMSVIAKRAGKIAPSHPLWALNWCAFGTPGNQPCLGDVLVFVRDGGGHVGLYVAEDKTAYHVLGGNESDQVMITRILKVRLHCVRRPEVKIAPAPSAKPFIMDGTGLISGNEA